jgi:hypothetical protein
MMRGCTKTASEPLFHAETHSRPNVAVSLVCAGSSTGFFSWRHELPSGFSGLGPQGLVTLQADTQPIITLPGEQVVAPSA